MIEASPEVPQRAAPTTQAAPSGDRVVIVHDYLTQRGGAERVVLSMLKAFPGAPVLTSLYDPRETYPEFRDHEVRTLGLNSISILRKNHRLALPLLPSAFSREPIVADTVLCSTSGWAHGVRTRATKIVYCHSPARWLYLPEHYVPARARHLRLTRDALQRPLELWDRRAAASATRYLVNSQLIRRRVRQVYGIEAEVLPPPHTADPGAPQLPIDGIEPGFFLVVARLNGYKHVDAVVSAFDELPRERLVVVGTGPEQRRLRELAGPNVRFLGSVPDESLRWLYANCFALVAASFEDFGLVPLECAAFGRPSLALSWGGYLETVVDQVTGLFFPTPEPSSIRIAVRRMRGHTFDEQAIVGHAAAYSESAFITKLQGQVERG